MKLNRKGYLTIEIILASAIAFVIAFFLIDITMKLVDKTDNYYVDTVFMTDKALITKNIKELIENDINDLGIIKKVYCSDNSCTIIFNNNNTNPRNLTIGENNDENSKVISYSSNEGNIYTKKFDTKLSGNVGISVSTSTDKKYIVFYMKFTNIFEGNDYDIIIPILNEKVLKKYYVYLDVHGYYGNQQTTIEFDNSDYGPRYDVFTNYDQLFHSYKSSTDLKCYIDKEKTTEYNFYQLYTIRYQSFVIDFTTDIPTKLYCDFSEEV